MADTKEDKGLHVAIIMDGNGRWGVAHKGSRTLGHIKGALQVKKIITHAEAVGVDVLTLWGYSTDNESRPDNEIKALMNIFQKFIVRETSPLDQKNVRVTFIGDPKGLPSQLQRVMTVLVEKTQNNDGLHLQIALNYGGQDEIIRAVNKAISAGQPVTAESFTCYLDTAHMPNPDVIVRTSGEKRLSGFMPYQSKHSELIFVDTLWPDFTPKHFDEALAEFRSRDRRYGGLSKKAV